MERKQVLDGLLKSLGNKWKPDHGPQTIKKIWDANRKQYNLNYFVDYKFIVLLEDEKETVEALVELNTQEEVDGFIRFNDTGICGWKIYDLDDGTLIYNNRPRAFNGRRINECD